MPKIKDDALERVRILEKAVANLGDTLKKRDCEYAEELHDILTELKALKLFLSRNVPEFKKEFPEIQRKVR
ncbi:MAG: hypothetical protein HGB21_02965 [Nitrospirae bacterium]|nr:hypothetical protein [Nitrospirota bacterium]NTW65266.1 hypothetical protein [Nitrospirota bacterium]